MLQTVEQFITDFRSDVFDKADVDDAGNARDTLWSDDEVLRYLNSACARWASDTLALRRRFEFTITADNALVRFPYSEIIEVLSIAFVITGRRRHLIEFDIDEGICTDDYGQAIHTQPDLDRTGLPSHYTRDWDNQFLRLYPVPYIDGTLSVNAIVLPQELYPGMPLPATARQDIDLIMLLVKKAAYSKQDADVQDLSRASTFENEYRRMVLDRRSEIDRIRRNGGVMVPR